MANPFPRSCPPFGAPCHRRNADGGCVVVCCAGGKRTGACTSRRWIGVETGQFRRHTTRLRCNAMRDSDVACWISPRYLTAEEWQQGIDSKEGMPEPLAEAMAAARNEAAQRGKVKSNNAAQGKQATSSAFQVWSALVLRLSWCSPS
eukprot:854835-Rhodomonas_salina.2